MILCIAQLRPAGGVLSDTGDANMAKPAKYPHPLLFYVPCNLCDFVPNSQVGTNGYLRC